MQENTNKIIAFNTVILYAKLAITTICGILTARFALKALGIDDYGLFSVLGSIISLIDIINTIMIGTTIRFMTVAIGKGNPEEINKQFNINRNIHIAVAIITILIAFPIGSWYVHTHLNYSGDINNAMMVFSFSIVASIITFLGVPYEGLMRAKENFLTPSVVGVISSVSKLVFVILLVHFFEHKLFIYALFTAVLTAFPTIVYIIYCTSHYKNVVAYRKIRSRSSYKEMLGFAGWSAYESFATVVKGQGAAILINNYFTTVMNAALGFANTINSFIMTFAQNTTIPMMPQITKNYACGNKLRCDELITMTTKFAYLFILFISTPFLIDCEWIMNLWLGEVPPYAVSFTKLLIIDSLVGAFNHGIQTLVRADGRIGLYTFSGNTLRLLALGAAFIVLKNGCPPESLFYTYIISTLIIVVLNQIIIHRQLGYDNTILIKKSYIPSILVTILSLPCFIIKLSIHPILSMLIGLIIVAGFIYLVGLSKSERKYVLVIINKVKHNVQS